MTDEPIATQILAAGRSLLDDGLVLGTAGNVSVRTDDGVLISPSSIPWDKITAEDICRVDAHGNQRSGRGRPSSETPMHLAIYRTTGARAVVHTHSPAAVAVSSVVDALPAIHYAVAQFGGHDVRVADYERFGSDALARAAERAIEGRYGVILRNHGTVTCGDSLPEALHRARLLEWLAIVYRDARLMGAPTLLSVQDLEQVVAESRRRRYGGA
jgi:L-fuculose-phosphate aldolase